MLIPAAAVTDVDGMLPALGIQNGNATRAAAALERCKLRKRHLLHGLQMLQVIGLMPEGFMRWMSCSSTSSTSGRMTHSLTDSSSSSVCSGDADIGTASSRSSKCSFLLYTEQMFDMQLENVRGSNGLRVVCYQGLYQFHTANVEVVIKVLIHKTGEFYLTI